MEKVRKAISVSRDKAQSELLAGAVGTLLAMKAGATLWVVRLASVGHPSVPQWFWIAFGVSMVFALVVWLLHAATGPAALMGGIICLDLLLGQAWGLPWQQTGMPALIALFSLTFAATRYGRRRKEQIGTAEAQRGRRASQVIANLGVAGLCAGAASPVLFAACIAALAEAAADTVSSEMGQVLGRRTLLITTLQEVTAGTDGGISVTGTTLGMVTAGAIVLVTAVSGHISWQDGTIAWASGIAGLLFDSVLGATVERRGWLGNDLVNFSSTAFAATVACAGTRLLHP